MLLGDLYRILLDSEFIYLYSFDEYEKLWCGTLKDLPDCYMNCSVYSIYTHTIDTGSCLVINIEIA